MALGAGPGDAVFCPTFTFASTAEIVPMTGATPVFVDVDERTYNLDVESLKRAIAFAKAEGMKPAGVIAVDLFGLPADYDAIEAEATRTVARKRAGPPEKLDRIDETTFFADLARRQENLPIPANTSRHGNVVLTTMAKDEGPYLLEWVAYHHLLGFTDILFLTNDCSDGTDEMLDALAEGRACRLDSDFALHLTEGARFDVGIAGLDGRSLGTVTIRSGDPIRGIATSGQGGRSQSLGIADSVTVLARSAAMADAAATRLGNAVDLPAHPAIRRSPANRLHDDSDLGAAPVVTHVGPLSPADVNQALTTGATAAQGLRDRGLIFGAALFLRDQHTVIGLPETLKSLVKAPEYA